jgi:uncharacterized membrane protein
MIKQEKAVTYFIIFPVMSLLGLFCYYELHAGFSLWTFFVVWIVILAVITFWMYKKLYDNSIKTIKQNLNELKELDEIN